MAALSGHVGRSRLFACAAAALALCAAGAGAPGPAAAGEGRWTYEVHVIDGGARAGTYRQAEIAVRDNYRMIVRCGRDGQAYLSVRFGQDPRWPGGQVALLANVVSGDGVEVFDLGVFGFAQSVYTAAISPTFVAALRRGRSVTLEGKGFRFDRDFPLAGSSASLGQLDCV